MTPRSRYTPWPPQTGPERNAVARADNRPKITLACEECKRRNYITTKNKVNDRDRIGMSKYCSWCRRHTPHKETR